MSLSSRTGGTPDVPYDDGDVRYIDCPLCDSPDTRAEPQGEGRYIIHCVNLECTSNQFGEASIEYAEEKSPPRDYWVIIPTDSDPYVVKAITRSRAQSQHRRTEQWETTDAIGPFTKDGAEHVLEVYGLNI